MDRRQMIRIGGAALLGAALPIPSKSEGAYRANMKSKYPFKVALNTSTISGYKLSVGQQIDLCAEAGYDGIELWVRDVRDCVKKGGSLEALARQIKDANLQLENMIGFAPWMTGADGMKAMKEEMEFSARLGSKCIAATGFGLEVLDYSKMNDYAGAYRELIEFGEELNIIPLLELWGHRALSQLSDVVGLALKAGHRNASLLLDFYHLYRGGNAFESLSLLNGKALPVFHINDYPGNIPRERLKDTDRIFPGDGICPFPVLLPLLEEIGFSGALSLELFQAAYWEKYSAKELLRIGKEKIDALLSIDR